MQVKIHKGQSPGTLDEIIAEVRRFPYTPGNIPFQRAASLFDQPLISGDQKASGTASRIADREIFVSPRIGFHAANNRLDENARREVLTRALLTFARRLFQQTFEGLGFYIDIKGRPLSFINERQHALEVNRVVEARLCAGEDVAKQTRLFAERAQHVNVMID